MASNLVDITSATDFQENLSKDLDRVSVTYFWATWAEPCKKMTEVVGQLAKKHEKPLFLKVDAEALPDISESFNIESVPAFVVLKGHTLLGRVEGADEAALTKLVEEHSISPIKPLSTSDKTPAPPPGSYTPATQEKQEQEQPAEKVETPEELNARMRKIMDSDKVVLFMKGVPDAPRCGFSRKTVAALNDHGVKFTHFDILQDEAVRQGLKTYNNWPTFPQIIINGELIGGLDIFNEMISNGELKEVLENAGVTYTDL